MCRQEMPEYKYVVFLGPNLADFLNQEFISFEQSKLTPQNQQLEIRIYYKNMLSVSELSN